MAVRITCIKKANGDHENPYVAIESLTWINEESKNVGTTTRDDMYDFVNKGNRAFVRNAFGIEADLIARTSPQGTKYVKTMADNTTSDNLLKLPEC